MNEYKDYWHRAFDFQGVSSRKEYWMACLVIFIINAVGFIVVLIIATVINPDLAILIYKVIVLLWGIANIIPSLSILVRRLHDTNRSGWYIFLGLIPYVGAIILFVFTLLDTRDNNYCENT